MYIFITIKGGKCMANFSLRPGLITKESCLPEPLELVCVEVPKVFDQCLIKRCLKFKEGCDTKHTDEELRSNPLDNPKIFLGCRDFNIKLLSFDKIPLKCECGYNRLIINFTISFYADFLDNCGNHCSELFEINRTETVPRLYCPDSIARTSSNCVTNSEDAINDMLKLELVAECLDGCFTEDCNCNCVLDVTLGFFLIVKCQLVVQLLMPSYGYCPVPKPCKERPLEDPCKIFYKTPPPKFYPDQRLKPLCPTDCEEDFPSCDEEDPSLNFDYDCDCDCEQ